MFERSTDTEHGTIHGQKINSIQQAIEIIGKDPQLVMKRIDVTSRSGVAGERRNIALTLAVLDSRLLIGDGLGQYSLGLKNAGTSGSGKSHVLTMCLKSYPEECIHFLSSGSEKSFYYLDDQALAHKAVILNEGFTLQRKGDSEFAHIIRTLLSEGYASHQVTQKAKDGNFSTDTKIVKGPISFITTTTTETFESQLEDRIFTIHPDESIEQTKKIIENTAETASGKNDEIDNASINLLMKAFHHQLKPVKVIIPYAQQIATYINKNTYLPTSTRRIFKNVLSLIKSICCACQFQREKDKNSRIKADISDYHMALQMVSGTFDETISQCTQDNIDRLNFIKKNEPVQIKQIVSAWGVSKNAVSKWIKLRIKDNLIYWCDKNGNAFINEASAKKAKLSGHAYIKTINFSNFNINGLPTAYELTHDPAWAEGGEYFKFFNLHLDEKSYGCPPVESIGLTEG